MLVQVRTSSVNGFDTSAAAGYVAGMMEHRFPVVLGKDFAGTVVAVGDGVTGYQVGGPVFGVVTAPSPDSMVSVTAQGGRSDP